MDFSWSDEQLAFKQSIIKFAKNELNSAIIERDSKCLFEKTYGRNAFDLASRDWRFRRNAVVSGLIRSPLYW